MNENLLLVAILEIINKGQSFGFNTIFAEIQSDNRFVAITEKQFRDAFNSLKNNGCIVSREKNNPSEVKLNPDKDCLTHYNSLLLEHINEGETTSLIRNLTAKNLQLTNELIPLQKNEIKYRIIWGVLGAIGGAILSNIKDILEYIQKLIR